jgi:hypothetical protein
MRRGLPPPGTLLPLALAFAGAAYLGLRFHPEMASHWGWDAAMLAEAGLVGMAARPLFLRMASGRTWPEAARWLVLLAAGLALTLPYARPERVGAGDSQDYAEHLADFLVQVRHGVFPVLVGQSEYAFNGAFNPLRTAPYFQYAGGALDALTFGALGPYGLQNLEIILSLCAAGFSGYLCLRRISAGRAWLCMLLALLYISSPGVLALVYAGDMIPSWLTLPYLPIYTCLLVRMADRGASGPRLVAMAAVMAMIWCIHAPIAMWLSFIALPVILVRLATLRGVAWRGRALLGAGALLVFAVLAGYEFVSVAELGLPTLPRQTVNFRDGTVLSILRAGWAGIFRPVSPSGAQLLSDLQLSAPLWVGMCLGAVVWRRRGWGLRYLLAASTCLLLLLAPFAGLAGRIWHLSPAWVDQITDQWPMQRFYPILSAFAPFVFVQALRAESPGGRWRQGLVLFALALGCCWSGWEARKFLARGFWVALPPARSALPILGENSVFAIYSSGMLGGIPSYFSYGPVNASMQLHMLDSTTLELSQSNPRALLHGRAGTGRAWTLQFVPSAQGAEIRPPLSLAPGWSYLLNFAFKRVPPSGTLVVVGRSFYGEYPLPSLGRSKAFGAVSGENSSVVISVPGGTSETVSIRFVTATATMLPAAFAELEVVPYHPEDLPFHIVDLVPLRIRARTAGEGWLETSRIFIPGYQARVDGKPAQFARSPDGLVMIRVPAGESSVELGYPGSPLLRASFWVSLAGWLLAPFVWLAWMRPGADRAQG